MAVDRAETSEEHKDDEIEGFTDNGPTYVHGTPNTFGRDLYHP